MNLFRRASDAASDATPPAALAPGARSTSNLPAYAPTDSERMWALKEVRHPREVPHYTEVLTAPNGKIALREDQRDRLVVLLADNGDAMIVCTNRRTEHRKVVDVLQILKQDGYTTPADKIFEATSDIVQLFYGSPAALVASSVPEYRGRMDDLFDEIVALGIELHASDIHFQVNQEDAVILLRVNGDLMHVRHLRRDVATQLSEAIFNFADADSKQTTFNPKSYQDAAVTRKVTVKGQEQKVHLKLRYASMVVYPDSWDIVLRILPMGQGGRVRTLHELGNDSAQEHAYERALSRPSGMICLCGTTGSGKSTTIQTLCSRLADRYQGRKLIRTIEDPPEYIIPGARQTPVVRKQSESEGSHGGFAAALKAAMRGDPDVIMVGEVRDSVTASLLQQAVQTGHKVVTTVHAGNPFDAIDRLIDLGVQRSVLAGHGFISAIVYQRLLPIVCPDCAQHWHDVEHRLPEDFSKRVQDVTPDPTVLRFRREGGCNACRGQGVIGRTVAAEILVPDRQLQHYILTQNKNAMQAYWRGGFMKQSSPVNGVTALDQAIAKMHAGQICPRDVEHEMGWLDENEAVALAREWYLSEYHAPGVAKR